ncbi:MAG: cytidine deaminase [Myxococcales bacterium]|nr:cytidine deaminase [Myxococcales bacterium]
MTETEDAMVDADLLQAARDALGRSHAPYSRFHVAAAVRAHDGRVFVGVNVENASYGLTVCAERVAVFSAVAAGATQLEQMALTTEPAPTRPEHSMPCGACRQVMAEFMQPSAGVLVDRVGSFQLAELLPHPFVLSP